MLTLFCPKCGKTAEVDPAIFHQRRRCPMCDTRLHDVSSLNRPLDDSPTTSRSMGKSFWILAVAILLGLLGIYLLGL
jgi:uncharacterized paraquat-inducible protein A